MDNPARALTKLTTASMNIFQIIRADIPRSLFFLLIVLASAYGFMSQARTITSLQAKRQNIPYTFYGDLFTGLAETLHNERYLGYFTDKNIETPLYGAQFTQAQLGLAPLILDLGSTSRRFTLFDCLDTKSCLEKIQAIGARPLKITKQGLILTIKQ